MVIFQWIIAIRIRRPAGGFRFHMITFDVPPITPERVFIETLEAFEFREEPLLSKDDNTYDFVMLAQIYARGRFFIDENTLLTCMQDLDLHVASFCMREYTPKTLIGPNMVHVGHTRRGWRPVIIVHDVETAMAELFLKMAKSEPHYFSISAGDESLLLSAFYGLVAILTS